MSQGKAEEEQVLGVKTRGAGPSQRDCSPALPSGGKLRGGGDKRKGAFKTLSPHSSLSLSFFFLSCFCLHVILAGNKTKQKAASLKGNGKIWRV